MGGHQVGAVVDAGKILVGDAVGLHGIVLYNGAVPVVGRVRSVGLDIHKGRLACQQRDDHRNRRKDIKPPAFYPMPLVLRAHEIREELQGQEGEKQQACLDSPQKPGKYHRRSRDDPARSLFPEGRVHQRDDALRDDRGGLYGVVDAEELQPGDEIHDGEQHQRPRDAPFDAPLANGRPKRRLNGGIGDQEEPQQQRRVGQRREHVRGRQDRVQPFDDQAQQRVQVLAHVVVPVHAARYDADGDVVRVGIQSPRDAEQ